MCFLEHALIGGKEGANWSVGTMLFELGERVMIWLGRGVSALELGADDGTVVTMNGLIAEGDVDGIKEGFAEGDIDGIKEGFAEGDIDGINEGFADTVTEGLVDETAIVTTGSSATNEFAGTVAWANAVSPVATAASTMRSVNDPSFTESPKSSDAWAAMFCTETMLSSQWAWDSHSTCTINLNSMRTALIILALIGNLSNWSKEGLTLPTGTPLTDVTIAVPWSTPKLSLMPISAEVAMVLTLVSSIDSALIPSKTIEDWTVATAEGKLGEGAKDGTIVGNPEGTTDGFPEGSNEGMLVGRVDGEHDGFDEVLIDGLSEGLLDGEREGGSEGDLDGWLEGGLEGDKLGLTDGKVEGIKDGLIDGVKVGGSDNDGVSVGNIDGTKLGRSGGYTTGMSEGCWDGKGEGT